MCRGGKNSSSLGHRWRDQQPAAFALLILAVTLTLHVVAQPAAGQRTSDTPGGYIDSAAIGTRARVRFDAAYGASRPDRAEFFYGKYGGFRLIGDPSAPGPLPLYNEAGNGVASTSSKIVDRNVDFQEAYIDLEQAFGERCSVFVELPFRFLNPEFSANTAGLGDVRTGFKYALIAEPDRYLTFQLRNYLPTGEALAGLGTNHYSIEPGLLFYDEVTPRLTLEGELRAWIPLGGSNATGVTLGVDSSGVIVANPQETYASEIIRYGLGVSYDLFRLEEAGLSFTPVVEFVGWEVLGGFKVFPTDDGTKDFVHTADRAKGDSIVNVKFGMRVVSDAGNSLYVGYGRALTDEVWYSDTLRLEYSRFFAPGSGFGSRRSRAFAGDGWPHLTFSAGGVFLDRRQEDSVFAMTDGGPVLAPSLGFQSGMRVGAQWHQASHDIEVNYFGLFSGLDQGFAGEGPANGSTIPGTSRIPTTPEIVLAPDSVFQDSYVSTLNSVEFNIRKPLNSRIVGLFGYRWLGLDEDFDYAVNVVPGFTSDFAARTDVNNNLFGCQIGANIRLWDSGRFHLDSLIKSGVYFSHAEHDARFAENGLGSLSSSGFTNRTFHDTSERAAFLGECALTGSIDLNDSLSLRLGYQAMWLSGVALGPEQIAVINGDTGTGIDSSGSVFWHGGLAQIETTW